MLFITAFLYTIFAQRIQNYGSIFCGVVVFRKTVYSLPASLSESRRVAIEESRAAIEESRAERVEVEVEGVVDEEKVEIVGVVGVELEGAVGEKRVELEV